MSSQTARSAGTGRSSNRSKVDPAKEKEAAELLAIRNHTTDEMKAMRNELRIMKAECDNETRLTNDFQQQKNKLEILWQNEKKKRDELKMHLRNKLKQKQDLEEKNDYELKIYKQKVKHLLQEQQQSMTQLKINSEIQIKKLIDQTRNEEHELSVDNRGLKVMAKEMEVAHLDLIKSLKQAQEKNIMVLRGEYSRKSEEIRHHYEKKSKTVREAMDEISREDINRIEIRKNTHIAELMNRHSRKFDKIKKYYSDITHANLELIKNLKEEVGDMKKKEAAVQKEVNEIKRINKKLSKPLQRNRKLIHQLKQDLKQYKKDKIDLATVKQELCVIEEKIKNKEWEHEILTQKFDKLKEERAAVESHLSSSIYMVQQKVGFSHLLLTKKLEAMAQDLEKTESALAEVLASTNLHPEVIGNIQHNLEDVLMSKNKMVQKLEDQLEDVRRRYANTVQLYEAKLKQYQIPVEELAFTVNRRI